MYSWSLQSLLTIRELELCGGCQIHEKGISLWARMYFTFTDYCSVSQQFWNRLKAILWSHYLVKNFTVKSVFRWCKVTFFSLENVTSLQTSKSFRIFPIKTCCDTLYVIKGLSWCSGKWKTSGDSRSLLPRSNPVWGGKTFPRQIWCHSSQTQHWCRPRRRF